MNQERFVNIARMILFIVLAGTLTQPLSAEKGQEPVISDTAEYPYILKQLSQTSLSGLRSEFEASNENICIQINEYGFAESKGACFDGPTQIKITDEDSIVEMVKEWLVKNSKFTGVIKKSDAVVAGVGKIYNQRRIDFRAQTYNGLPMEGDAAPLRVFAHARGVSRIGGHWFPTIEVPLEPTISEAFIKNKLNGRIFTYGDYAGKPRNYRIEQKDLSNVAHKVVFVKKSPQGLEFRLAWKMPVGQKSIPSWIVYVDAITGEELEIVQGFQT